MVLEQPIIKTISLNYVQSFVDFFISALLRVLRVLRGEKFRLIFSRVAAAGENLDAAAELQLHQLRGELRGGEAAGGLQIVKGTMIVGGQQGEQRGMERVALSLT